MSDPPLEEVLPGVAASLADLNDPGWCVVLYSGECEEHIGLRCAIEVVYRPGMTNRQAAGVASRVRETAPQSCPHMVPVNDPSRWGA